MSILEHWQHQAVTSQNHLVLPDGSMDLICSIDTDGIPTWFISELASTAYAVDIEKGEKTQGLRLHTGASIHKEAALASISDGSDMSEIKKNIAEFITINTNIDDALAVLLAETNVKKASQVLGVSTRSLQRLLVTHTHKSPSFWLRLGKIRSCAQQMVNPSNTLSLAELAYDMGYTDQAHMNHEFQHWFGMTPRQFANRPDMIEAINASGYGTLSN